MQFQGRGKLAVDQNQGVKSRIEDHPFAQLLGQYFDHHMTLGARTKKRTSKTHDAGVESCAEQRPGKNVTKSPAGSWNAASLLLQKPVRILVVNLHRRRPHGFILRLLPSLPLP